MKYIPEKTLEVSGNLRLITYERINKVIRDDKLPPKTGTIIYERDSNFGYTNKMENGERISFYYWTNLLYEDPEWRDHRNWLSLHPDKPIDYFSIEAISYKECSCKRLLEISVITGIPAKEFKRD